MRFLRNHSLIIALAVVGVLSLVAIHGWVFSSESSARIVSTLKPSLSLLPNPPLPVLFESAGFTPMKGYYKRACAWRSQGSANGSTDWPGLDVSSETPGTFSDDTSFYKEFCEDPEGRVSPTVPTCRIGDIPVGALNCYSTDSSILTTSSVFSNGYPTEWIWDGGSGSWNPVYPFSSASYGITSYATVGVCEQVCQSAIVPDAEFYTRTCTWASQGTEDWPGASAGPGAAGTNNGDTTFYQKRCENPDGGLVTYQPNAQGDAPLCEAGDSSIGIDCYPTGVAITGSNDGVTTFPTPGFSFNVGVVNPLIANDWGIVSYATVGVCQRLCMHAP